MVERYHLDVVRFTSTHGTISRTKLLERGQRVAQGDRQQAGLELLVAPQFGTNLLEFTPVNERITYLRLQIGTWAQTVVCAYATNISSEYLAFLETVSWSTGRNPFWGLYHSTVGLRVLFTRE